MALTIHLGGLGVDVGERRGCPRGLDVAGEESIDLRHEGANARLLSAGFGPKFRLGGEPLGLGPGKSPGKSGSQQENRLGV